MTQEDPRLRNPSVNSHDEAEQSQSHSSHRHNGTYLWQQTEHVNTEKHCRELNSTKRTCPMGLSYATTSQGGLERSR